MNVVKDDAYSKRQEAFLTKLFQLHQMNGNPIKRIPLLGGKELDLYHLYQKVQSLGGSEKVTKDRMWGEVARSFNLPPSVTSASYACRQNFIKFLEQYETLDHSGTPFDPDTYVPPAVHTPQTTLAARQTRSSSLSPHLANQLQIHSLGSRTQAKSSLATAIPGLPGLLQFTPAQFQQLQLLLKLQAVQLEQQRHLVQTARYDWLVRSLQCGLPNEVDFAFNVLIILSHDDKRVMPVGMNPHLLDAVLAHIGIFSEDDPGLELMYWNSWHKDRDQDYHQFWNETVPLWVLFAVFPKHTEKGPRFPELFPQRMMMTNEGCGIERLRVEQVANVLRNFSFEECNAQYLAQQEGMIRFLFLAVNCSLPVVKMCALDILSNIAHHLLISRDSLDPSYLLLASLHQCVLSDDRLAILRGMETIGQLAWCLHNESALSCTPPDVYQRMVQLLLVLDCQLILTSLDTLYNLSFYGEHVARAILEVTHSVETLVNLLTVTIDDLGTSGMEGLSLVHVNGRVEPLVKRSKPPTTESSLSNTASTSTGLSHLHKSVSMHSTSVGGASSTHVTSVPSTTTPKVVTTVPATPVMSSVSSKTLTTMSRLLPLPQLVGTPISPNSDSNSPVQLTSRFIGSGLLAQKSLPKELFATEWLRSEYEPSREAFVSKVELFSRYLSHCSLVGQTELVSQSELDSIIRKLFSEVIFTNVKIGGQDIGLVGGVGRRKQTALSHVPVKSLLLNSPQTQSVTKELTEPFPTSKPLVASSLSPLQQLMLATKAQNAVAAARVSPTPSPLLIANKMPAHSTNQIIPTSSVVSCSSGTTGINVASLLQKNLWALAAAGGKTQQAKDIASPGKNFTSNTATSSGVGMLNGSTMGVQMAFLPSSRSGGTILVNGKASREEVMLIDGRKRPRSTSPIDVEELTASKEAKRTQLSNETLAAGSSHLHMHKPDSNSAASPLNLSLPSCPSSSSLVLPALNSNCLPSPSSLRESSSLQDNHSSLPHMIHDHTTPNRHPLMQSRSASPIAESSRARDTRSTSPVVLPVPPLNQSNFTSPNISETLTNRPESSTSMLMGSRSSTPSSGFGEGSPALGHVSGSCVAVLPGFSKAADSSSSKSSTSSSNIDPKLICLWENCLQIRASWGDLFRHVVYDHIPQLESFPITCMWAGCPNKCKRMRPSLIRHVQTHHCSSDPKPAPPNVADTLMKLKSMSPFEVEQESQLTKSIRLTAALVLRNLVQTLPAAKRHLIRHECKLAQVALSGTEASSIAAQCLSYLVTSPSPPTH